MENSVEPKAFQLPLEHQFSMKKAEIKAKEMTWDQLYVALLSLYHQRLMEIYALKSMMAEENVEVDFDVPTDVELLDLATKAQEVIDEELDEEDGEEPLSI
tara:strand:+ start:1896 stop:2198 length:303 start_codon:yes stop_codon:yes gene_type:complete